MKGNKRMTQEKNQILDGLSGPIPYTLTNDYMFKASFQSSPNALRGFLSAILDIPERSITKVDILNPIELGKSISEKTCILDIKIEVNNAAFINIEMQVAEQHYWAERALLYLCRCYDSLKKGDDYSMLKQAIHIGITDFTPFPENAKLHSKYLLQDTETQYVFSSKFVLHVLDLKEIDSEKADAGDELHRWARLFKATTWEEVKQLAKQSNSESMMELVFTMHELSEDEKVRAQCEAREREELDRLTMERELEREQKRRKEVEKERDVQQSRADAAEREREAQQNRAAAAEREREEERKKNASLEALIAKLQAQLKETKQ